MQVFKLPQVASLKAFVETWAVTDVSGRTNQSQIFISSAREPGGQLDSVDRTFRGADRHSHFLSLTDMGGRSRAGPNARGQSEFSLVECSIDSSLSSGRFSSSSPPSRTEEVESPNLTASEDGEEMSDE